MRAKCIITFPIRLFQKLYRVFFFASYSYFLAIEEGKKRFRFNKKEIRKKRRRERREVNRNGESSSSALTVISQRNIKTWASGQPSPVLLNVVFLFVLRLNGAHQRPLRCIPPTQRLDKQTTRKAVLRQDKERKQNWKEGRKKKKKKQKEEKSFSFHFTKILSIRIGNEKKRTV